MSTQKEEAIEKELAMLCSIKVPLLKDNPDHAFDDELTSNSVSDMSSNASSEAKNIKCTLDGFGVLLCSSCKKEVGHIKGGGDVVGHHERCHKSANEKARLRLKMASLRLETASLQSSLFELANLTRIQNNWILYTNGSTESPQYICGKLSERDSASVYDQEGYLASSPWFYTYDFPLNHKMVCSEAVRRLGIDIMSAFTRCKEVGVLSVDLWDTVRGFEGVILLNRADDGTEEIKVSDTTYYVEVTEKLGEPSAKYKLTYKPYNDEATTPSDSGELVSSSEPCVKDPLHITRDYPIEESDAHASHIVNFQNILEEAQETFFAQQNASCS